MAPGADATGRFVVFVSSADVGFGVPEDGRQAIYVRNRATGDTVAAAHCYCPDAPAVSLDGTRIVFRVAGPDGTSAAYYKDSPFTGEPVPIEVGALSTTPALSGNGRFVAFSSTGDLDGAPDDSSGTPDIFIRDLIDGRTERLTRGAHVSATPSISADGRYVVFTTSDRLVAEDINDTGDVYLVDRAPTAPRVRLLTSPTSGLSATAALIAAGGTAVAFTSAADLFVTDLRAGTTTRVGAASSLVAISGNGRRVAFTAASGGSSAFYIYDLNSGEIVLSTTSGALESAAPDTGTITADGRTAMAMIAANDAAAARLPPDVPAGSAVRGDPFDPVTGSNPVTLVFSTVSAAGNVSIAISPSGPALPGDIVPVSNYFSLSTTATASGSTLVCASLAGSATSSQAPRMMHWSGGAWSDVTANSHASRSAVCGQTTTLGMFVLAAPLPVSPSSSSSREKNKATSAISNIVTWNVDADGFWDVASNWSGGAVPADGDTVVIDRPAGGFVITVRTATANVLSVFATEQLVVTGALTISGTGTFNGGLLMSGVLTGTGTIQLGANAAWQTANGDTFVGVAGGVDVQPGVTLAIGANAGFENYGHYLDTSAIRNHGTVVWTNSLLQLRNGSVVTVDAGTLWDTQADLLIGSDGCCTPVFTNNGTVRKSGGAGTWTIGGAITFINHGTIDLQTGAIGISGQQLTTDGLLQVAAGATFRLDKVTLQAGSTFAGLGLLHANGNTTVTGDITVTIPLRVTVYLTGSGRLRLAASTTWQNASGDTIIGLAGGVDVQAGTTLSIGADPGFENYGHYLDTSSIRNHGTVVWTSSLLQLRNGSTVTIDTGTLWDVRGDLMIGSDGGGTPTFTNNGTLRKSAGTSSFVLGGAVAFTNHGTIDLQTGVIAVSGQQLTTDGLLQVAAGATFRLDKVTLETGSTFAGSGLLHANGATTVSADITVTIPLRVTVYLTGNGRLRLAASTTWQNASGDTIIGVAGGVDVEVGTTLSIGADPGFENYGHYLDTSSIRNHGTVVWTSSLLQLRNGSTVTVDTGTLWDAHGDLMIGSDGGGTPAFTNNGTLRKSAGTASMLLGGAVAFTNHGTIDLQTGAIAVSGPQLTTDGLLQVAGGATFYLDKVTLLAGSTFAGSGLLHANGATTVSGDITVTLPLRVTVHVIGSGRLRLAAPATWLGASGDTVITLAGGIDVQPGVTLAIGSNPGFENYGHYLDTSSLRNHGTVVWSASSLYLRNGSTVTVDAGTIWDTQGDFLIGSDGAGTPAFTNNGTLRKSAGTANLVLGGAVAFTNHGTIDLQSGLISVGSGQQLTSDGLLQVASGATFNLDKVTLLAGSTFAGSGLLHANGTTTVTGDITVTLPLRVTVFVTGSGRLRLAAPATWLGASGDTIIGLAGGIDVQPGVTLAIGANPGYENYVHFFDTSSLRNHGTVLWSASSLYLRNGSSATNESDGIWEVQNSLLLSSDGSGVPSFVDNGILRRSGAPNKLTLTVPFTNNGTFDVRIGGMAAGQLDEFVGGTIGLGGTLSAHLLNGLTPGPADQFKVMDGTSGSGAFSTFVGDGFTFTACYTPTAVFVCNIVMAKQTPTITWADPADIAYGTPLGPTQLDATASVPGSFVYAPASGTILNTGNGQALQATFTPTDTVHYNTVVTIVHINVVRATPTITWGNPAAIFYGTALSASQLNATANVPGSFVYTPAAGTKLHAGNNQQLSAAFTPTDTTNYEPVNSVRSINVMAAPLTISAANANKVFGAPLPGFTAGFSGFVNGDTAASLSGTLVLSTTATAASPVGAYPIAVGGVSSSDYAITFVPGTLTIAPASTTTTLYVLPPTTGFLQPVYAIAVVAPVAPGAGIPSGVVQFTDGGSALGSASLISGVGIAFIVGNGLAPGVHSITAAFTGSANFAGSTSAPGTTTVSAVAASTFTYLVPPATPPAVGAPAPLVAAVIPLGGGTATGTVQFSDGQTVIGSAAVIGGVATINPTTLTVGTHLLTARYMGNATFAASTSPPAAVTIYSGIRPASTVLALAASANPSTLGQAVTFTATVTGGATSGTVNFYSDGVPIGQAAIVNVGGNFKATLNTADLSAGLHVVSASFMGSPGFAGSNGLAVQAVQAPGASPAAFSLSGGLPAVPGMVP